MTMRVDGEMLRVSDIKELSAANANVFRDEVLEAFAMPENTIEVDLSDTLFIDSCGVGALISLNRVCGIRRGKVRLRNPSPAVEQLLELTRVNKVLEITKDVV